MAKVKETVSIEEKRKELFDEFTRLYDKGTKLGATLVLEFFNNFDTKHRGVRIWFRHPKTKVKYGMVLNPDDDASLADWVLGGITATLRKFEEVSRSVG